MSGRKYIINEMSFEQKRFLHWLILLRALSHELLPSFSQNLFVAMHEFYGRSKALGYQNATDKIDDNKA